MGSDAEHARACDCTAALPCVPFVLVPPSPSYSSSLSPQAVDLLANGLRLVGAPPAGCVFTARASAGALTLTCGEGTSRWGRICCLECGSGGSLMPRLMATSCITVMHVCWPRVPWRLVREATYKVLSRTARGAQGLVEVVGNVAESLASATLRWTSFSIPGFNYVVRYVKDVSRLRADEVHRPRCG